MCLTPAARDSNELIYEYGLPGACLYMILQIVNTCLCQAFVQLIAQRWPGISTIVMRLEHMYVGSADNECTLY